MALPMMMIRRMRRNRLESRHFSSHDAGWKIPLPRDNGGAASSSNAVKPVQVSLPNNIQPLELCFKEKFTVSPGSFSSGDMTGTWIWPTARKMLAGNLLAKDLDTLLQRNNATSLNILELGSGCGLLGMALAAGMGNTVLLTEHEENIEWLRQNVELNKHVLDNRATTAVLTWGNDTDMAAIENDIGSFDAIVASDVIYDPNSHQVLLKTMRRFAWPKRAPVFLGYPDRGSCEADFFGLSEQYFESIQITPMEDDDECNLMYAVCRIRE